MTRSDRQWLSAAPWESVLAVNKALCQAQKIEPLNAAKGYEPACRLWEKSIQKSMSLQEALGVCRDCHELAPFTFNNGNTFAAIGRKELQQVLRHFEPLLNAKAPAARPVAEPEAIAPPQEQRASA